MQRGQYNATAHVLVGALYQVAAVACIISACLESLVASSSAEMYADFPVFWFVGVPFGMIAAVLMYWVYWDRIEAYSSRFCSGLANLSLLYVPLIAFVYANVLCVRELWSAGRAKFAAS